MQAMGGGGFLHQSFKHQYPSFVTLILHPWLHYLTTWCPHGVLHGRCVGVSFEDSLLSTLLGFLCHTMGWFPSLSTTVPPHHICSNVGSNLWDLCFLSVRLCRIIQLLLRFLGHILFFVPIELYAPSNRE